MYYKVPLRVLFKAVYYSPLVPYWLHARALQLSKPNAAVKTLNAILKAEPFLGSHVQHVTSKTIIWETEPK